VEGDPLRTGAWGAGIALESGVEASVEATEEAGIRVELNGVEGDWRVARAAVEKVAERAGYAGGLRVKLRVEPPIGGGLGTSGASALSAALAAAQALNARLSYMELARIAHIVELESGTGLGTVSGLVVGGPVIVLEPGAPGYDRVDRILAPANARVIVGFYSPMDKAGIVKGRLGLIDRLGLEAVRKLEEEPTLRRLLELSKRFAYEAGLATPRVRAAIELLERHGYPASMAMLGETVFTVVEEGAREAARLLEESGARVLVSRISWSPARPL